MSTLQRTFRSFKTRNGCLKRGCLDHEEAEHDVVGYMNILLRK